MTEPTDLAARVARLERHLTRTRAALGLAALAGAALFAAGAGAQEGAGDVVAASAFVLRDADGRVHADLRLTGEGAELRFLNADGDAQAVLGIDAEGPGFLFTDEDGNERVEMEIEGERGLFALTDRQGVNVYQKRW